MRNLAKMDLRRTDHPLPLLHGYELHEENLESIIEDLAGRTMKQRARLRGLNPDRADSIVGGAIVVLAAMRHLGAERVVVSSRGLREGLALGDPSAAVPTPRQVRTISAATLAARFATWDAVAAERRSSLASQLIDALDPETTAFIAESLEHAAALLDVGKAIDYYERFEHAAMIVTTADLAGFTHEALGILSAILRHAGGDDEPRSVRSDRSRPATDPRYGVRPSRSPSPKSSIGGSRRENRPRSPARGGAGSRSRPPSRRDGSPGASRIDSERSSERSSPSCRRRTLGRSTR